MTMKYFVDWGLTQFCWTHESETFSLTWAVTWPFPTSPHRIDVVRCCLAGKQILRREYWTSPSRTEVVAQDKAEILEATLYLLTLFICKSSDVPAEVVVSVHCWTSPLLPRTTGSLCGCHGNLNIVYCKYHNSTRTRAPWTINRKHLLKLKLQPNLLVLIYIIFYSRGILRSVRNILISN